MIPAVAASNLADYIDVFCEQGFFSKEDTIRIGQAGINFGLKPRLHANQLSRSGGVQAGVALKAISVDHLENIGPEEIALLAGSSVIPTVLPGAAFFLNLPMPPARDMINAGLPIAIASDYNPGSSPSGNMPLMISLACIRMRMTPEEAKSGWKHHRWKISQHGDHETHAFSCISSIFLRITIDRESCHQRQDCPMTLLFRLELKVVKVSLPHPCADRKI
jgi:imidazolonepropionase